MSLVVLVAGALALSACSDDGPVEAARIDTVTPVGDGTRLSVRAAGCFDGARVQVGETGDSVTLLWLGRTIGCGDHEVGILESVDVRLDQPLGDRTVTDLGCQLVRPSEPCVLQVGG